MGYDDEMSEYYDEQKEYPQPLGIGSMKFKKDNLISSNGVSFKTLVWNYFCWILIGKPNNWRPYGK